MRPKSALVAAGAVGLVALSLAGVSIVGAASDDARTSMSEREQSLAARETSLRLREAELSDFERRKTEAESAARDAERRLAELETRRSDLQRQVAELTAPIAPAAEDERRAPAAGDDHARAADDPSPPDEDPGDGALSTASRPAGETPNPSSARVDAAAEVAKPEGRASGRLAAVALPGAGLTRVFIHVPFTDPVARARAQAVAAELRRRGVDVAEIRGVPRRVRRDAVRYYYDADREAVTTLQEAVRQASPRDEAPAQAQDFRGYRAPPRPGTLELWLS
ncbi:hypothetical protein IHQ68_02305 [Chelatococcus sambhunathii]|uniref:SPOR domain-containing protein n=1 Tax=Chelatococcus sambhunathii TaxID=363953 RepID=A0ABU1DBL0_9HYPH|nr:hypothetical protein [Chelatococcus sambhunathii]MDR4305455.1 hypothetical protein [Chelatococcus sambhunathii]